MRILYADDDRDDCEIFSEALNKIDPSVSCEMVCDGNEVLQTLCRSSRLPDYIFLDINMPVMDGKTCLVELKKNQRLKNIPVIIYSTSSDKQEINQFYNLGALAYIQKPNNFSELCQKLCLFIRKFHLSRLKARY